MRASSFSQVSLIDYGKGEIKGVIFPIKPSFSDDLNIGAIRLREEDGQSLTWFYIFNLIFKKLPNCFQKWLYYFKFPLAVYESSSALSTPGMVMVFFLFKKL